MTKRLTPAQKARKERRRLNPAKPRHAAAGSAAAQAGAEPKGLAAREEVRLTVKGRLLLQQGADLAVAVALGNMTAAQARAEVSVEAVSLPEFVVVDRRGEVRTGAALRVSGRDGLASLHQSGGLTKRQAQAGLAFRLCYETSRAGLKSCLGASGGGGRKPRDVMAGRDPAELRRSYLMARLTQMERLAAGVDASGRALEALRKVAGEGATVSQLAGEGGNARAAWRAALASALDVIADHLRIRAD